MIHPKSIHTKFISFGKAPKYLQRYIVKENGGVEPKTYLPIQPTKKSPFEEASFFFVLNEREYNLLSKDIKQLT